MAEYRLVVNGRLPGLNEATAANRTMAIVGAKQKHEAQNLVITAIYRQLGRVRIAKPVSISCEWIEKNRRRDPDNISSFGLKIILDALVKTKVLADDGWDEIISFQHSFSVDKKRPRIEILITEVEG